MTRIVDDIILDPVEMSPDRTELSLSEMGLSVVGADFGEAAIEGASVRQQFGEALVDRRPKSKTVVLRLRVREDAEADLETAAYRLQQKVGTLHREGGWMRRDFHVGEFAGSLLCKIVGEVTLADLAGWQAGDSPDVTLTIVCGPIWYSTEVEESPLLVEEANRALVYELPGTAGTAEGLKRITVTNKNTSGDWRGMIWAEECRDFKEDETARPVYEAEDLTPKGTALVKPFAGASGGEVVERGSLTAGWFSILESQIQGVGHMTHLGTRRVKMRVYDSGNAPGGVELRLLWRALGSSRWSEDNAIAPVPVVDDFAIVDLGECRPQRAMLGEQRWEWKLMARAPGGSGTIRIDQVYVLPTEQYLELRTPKQEPGVLERQLPATAVSEPSASWPWAVPWTNPANAVTSNDSYATVTTEPSTSLETERLKVTNFGFALPVGATVSGVVIGVERKASAATGPRWVFDADATIVKGGVVQGVPDKAENFVYWDTVEKVHTYGASDDLWGQTWTAADINSSGFGFAYRAVMQSSNSDDPSKAAPPVTAYVDTIEITVHYFDPGEDNRVCYASRQVDLRSEGALRKHLTDEAWGALVPDGFLPHALPSALENRPVRGVILPSQGDFGGAADSGTNKLSAVIETRAGYHFAREGV